MIQKLKSVKVSQSTMVQSKQIATFSVDYKCM